MTKKQLKQALFRNVKAAYNFLITGGSSEDFDRMIPSLNGLALRIRDQELKDQESKNQ